MRLRPLLLLTGAFVALAPFAPVVAQPQLDVLIGERMDKDTELGSAMGCDDELFYMLRTESEKSDKRGFIDGWSRASLTKVFTKPLQVPVVNAEVFSVHEVIVGDAGLQLFYSFYSKQDGRRVLAMTNLDRQGDMVGNAIELIVEPGTKEKHSRRFFIRHFEESGMTVILNVMTINPGGYDGLLEPAMHVITLDGSGNIKADLDIHAGECRYTTLHDFAADGNGNVYLKFLNYGAKKDVCTHALVSAAAGSAKATAWCPPELPKGLSFRDLNGFYFDPQGNVSYVAPFANPNQYESVKGYEMHGVVVQSFNKENAERTLDKIYQFKYGYPDIGSSKDKKVMSNSNLIDISFQPDGTLNFYGAESFAKIGSGGENSFWGLKLDLDGGFGKPWQCTAQRQYVIYPGQESLFNYGVYNLGGHDFLLANELRANIGKPCKDMEDWTKAGANGDKTVPAYACLSDNGVIGPRQRLTSDALGSTQYYRKLLVKRGEEYIISVTSDQGRYLVRLRAAR